MDGLDEYRHDPMRWAVEVVLTYVTEIDANQYDERLINSVLDEVAYEFISGCFEEAALQCPSKQEITTATLQRFRD